MLDYPDYNNSRAISEIRGFLNRTFQNKKTIYLIVLNPTGLEFFNNNLQTKNAKCAKKFLSIQSSCFLSLIKKQQLGYRNDTKST